MAEDAGFQRRLPAVSRQVAEIRPEDIRVSILGTVIDKQEGTLVIDDGTGRVHVTVEEPITEAGRLVRVFGRVIPLENGAELHGELIQDMTGLDMELYKQVEELWKRL